jgi:putative CocE/NonD family hydrolase
MGSDGWRREHEWPLARTAWTHLYLRPFGRLSPAAEPAAESNDAFVQQPLTETSAIAEVAYSTDPLTEDTEVIGPVALTLYAAIDQPDTNWIVALEDVDAGGSARELTRGFLKASHRELDPVRSTEWEPYHPHARSEPVTPGAVCEYAIALSPTANVFKRGHRIRLRVTSLDYRGNPRPAPGVSQVHYPWHVCSARTTLHRVYHDRERPSALLLPLIPLAR